MHLPDLAVRDLAMDDLAIPDNLAGDLAMPIEYDDGGHPIIFDMQRPFGPWIAFTSNRSGNFDLYLVHPDGTGTNALVQTSGEDLFPAWSPDGSKVAFASNQSGSYQLYDVSILTGVVSSIPTGVAASTSPAYSPDGTTIAFGGDSAIYVVPALGGTATPVTDGSARDSQPVWAPDGSVIYFASNRSGSFEVWSVEPNGTMLTQVTTGTNLLGGPAISPDGKTLAMAVSSTQTSVIFWDLAMSTKSTFSAMGDTEPAFAKSGAQLAVTSTRYGATNPEIVILGVPGATSPFRLTDDPADDGQAAFQPVP